MPIPVQPGRVDLLLLALAEAGCRRYLDPHVSIPLWDAGLNQIAAGALQRVGIPQQPIASIQIGNLSLPIQHVEFIAKLCGFMPAGRINAGS